MNKDSEIQDLDLKKYHSFKEKIEALINYLHIGVIRCHVSESAPINSIEDVPDDSSIEVQSIELTKGSVDYITMHLQRIWPKLEESLEQLFASDEDFYTVRQILNDCKKLCYQEKGKYNYRDISSFHASRSFSIIKGESKFPAIYSWLFFTKEQISELRDHCEFRFSIFDRLYDLISLKQLDHANLPEIKDNPYSWNSDNAQNEIIELLFALKLHGRIKINKGSEVSFRESFFNLFGLHDKGYSERTYEIRNNQKKGGFLKELVNQIESTR